MARQQTGAPQGEAQQQASQGRSNATSGGSAAEGGRGSARSGEMRGDQELQRQVTREGGAAPGTGSTGTGMQRGTGSSGALAGRGPAQSSLLPAFMSNPALMASAFMSNPFAVAQAMSQEMDRLFSSLGADEPGLSYGQLGSGAGRGLTTGMAGGLQQGALQGGGLTQWVPQMDVLQRGNELVVRADLPGVRPEDVNIEVEDGMLTLSGERRQTSENREEGFYRAERSYGAFSRSIALPDGVDEDQVRARFEQGELEITVPLPRQRSRARRIPIQSGSSAGQGAGQQGAQASAQQQAGQQRAGQQRDGEAGQPPRT